MFWLGLGTLRYLGTMYVGKRKYGHVAGSDGSEKSKGLEEFLGAES